MSDMNIQSVLAQMRAMEAQAAARPAQPASVENTQAVEKTDFSEVLKNSIDAVNDTSMHAGKLASAFEKGDSNVSLAELMISMEKASVSFQAMTQVRNKLLSAYQDIMNMPV